MTTATTIAMTTTTAMSTTAMVMVTAMTTVIYKENSHYNNSSGDSGNRNYNDNSNNNNNTNDNDYSDENGNTNDNDSSNNSAGNDKAMSTTITTMSINTMTFFLRIVTYLKINIVNKVNVSPKKDSEHPM